MERTETDDIVAQAVVDMYKITMGLPTQWTAIQAMAATASLVLDELGKHRGDREQLLKLFLLAMNAAQENNDTTNAIN